MTQILNTNEQTKQGNTQMTTYSLTILSSFSHEVWKGEYRSNASGDGLLNELFRYFNVLDNDDADRLARLGYKLPSMSAGDVIAIDPEGKFDRSRMFVVDRIGFREIVAGRGLVEVTVCAGRSTSGTQTATWATGR